MVFATARQLDKLIAAYFKHIVGEYHLENVPVKNKTGDDVVQQKIWDCEPEPPTLSGLALYLGFDSRAAFELYEQDGSFAAIIKRARLRIEAEYEKRLHQQAPSGAIFALKNLGWNERDALTDNAPVGPLQIEIIESGIPTAGSETDVVL